MRFSMLLLRQTEAFLGLRTHILMIHFFGGIGTDHTISTLQQEKGQTHMKGQEQQCFSVVADLCDGKWLAWARCKVVHQGIHLLVW